jgi:hypothetical protein
MLNLCPLAQVQHLVRDTEISIFPVFIYEYIVFGMWIVNTPFQDLAKTSLSLALTGRFALFRSSF